MLYKRIIFSMLTSTYTTTITEGRARILTHFLRQQSLSQVFYNPIQVFNRDLTLLAISAFARLREKEDSHYKGLRIADALSASGLRTIRFLLELPEKDVLQVHANDLSEDSLILMQDNFKLNNLPSGKIEVTKQDANLLFTASKLSFPFHVIDIDPFGSAIPFLDSAIEGITDGGMLCVTCTDSRVLCGPDYQKCQYYYGSVRAKVMGIQENGLRVLLQSISTAATRKCKVIEPLFSIQAEFYLRVFVRVHRKKGQCRNSGLHLGNIFNCNACGNFTHSPLFWEKEPGKLKSTHLEIHAGECDCCGSSIQINGPVWISPLNSVPFMESMLEILQSKTQLQLSRGKQIHGMLRAAIQEHEVTGRQVLPVCFELMCKRIHASTPSFRQLESWILQAGHKIAPSYIFPGQYKTTAPVKVVYNLLVGWKKKITAEKWLYKMKEEEVGFKLCQKAGEVEVDFDKETDVDKRVTLHSHFFPHTQKHMGPKGKPCKKQLSAEELESLKQ